MSKKFYKIFAKYYDSFYSWKNYEAESNGIRSLINQRKSSHGRELLDVACGTGNHIQYMKKHFNITGLDVDPYMLKIARKKFPDIKFIRADMRTFSLNKQFDVIVCLFSAIGHLKTYTNLEKTIKNFSEHLKKGGVVVIEPFINPEYFAENLLDSYNINEPQLKLTRMNTTKRKGNVAIFDFHILVGEAGKIRYFKEIVQLGMYESRKVLNMMKKAGLKAEFLIKPKQYRGLYIGVKQ